MCQSSLIIISIIVISLILGLGFNQYLPYFSFLNLFNDCCCLFVFKLFNTPVLKQKKKNQTYHVMALSSYASVRPSLNYFLCCLFRNLLSYLVEILQHYIRLGRCVMRKKCCSPFLFSKLRSCDCLFFYKLVLCPSFEMSRVNAK